MTAPLAARANSLAFALEGVRVSRAARVVRDEGTALAAALRRAVPFLTRRPVPITLESAQAVAPAELSHRLTGPLHVTPIRVEPGGGAGALVLDGPALGILLDGIFGGTGKSTPTLDPAGLTPPQTAIAARLAGEIVAALSEALTALAGVSLVARGPSTRELSGSEGVPIACVLEIGEGDARGRVALLVPKEALLARGDGALSPTETPPRANPRVAAALGHVEIDVAVELTRMRMRVAAVAKLRAGDILRLDVGVESPVTVRIDDHALLMGLPTTAHGVIAVRIEPGTKPE